MTGDLKPECVAEVTSARQYPIVKDSFIDDQVMFDPNLHLTGETVTIYPPDLVVVKFLIANSHVVCRYAGGPYCVISAKRLKPSEVRRS